MATKIRLQRGGRKSYAFYRIVIADARAPRDGRFTEKIGTYNPNTNPATVDLDFDRALYWVETGAQPTATAHNILKGEGVYLMKHLRGGVKKGAFDEATAQKKFDAWKADKQKGLDTVRENEAKAKAEAAAKELEAEKKLNEAIAQKQRLLLTQRLQRKFQLRLNQRKFRHKTHINPKSTSSWDLLFYNHTTSTTTTTPLTFFLKTQLIVQ